MKYCNLIGLEKQTRNPIGREVIGRFFVADWPVHFRNLRKVL